MSTLEDFEKKIYGKGNLSFGSEKISAWTKEEKNWEKEERIWQPPKKRSEFFVFLSIFVFLLLIGGGIYFYYGSRAFKTSDIVLTISGPDSITSGEKIRYLVNYKNKSKVRLLDATMIFRWPDGSEISTPIETKIGSVLSQKEDVVPFEGRIFGVKDETKQVEVVFSYQPENYSVRFETKGTRKNIISNTPLFLSFDMPARIVSGKDFDFSVEYTNNSDATFDNLEMRLDYPENFTFKFSDHETSSSGNVFTLNKLNPKESEKIKISGNLNGLEGAMFNFKVSLGKSSNSQFLVYGEEQTNLQLSSSILWVLQTVEDSRDFVASAGETLHYKIRYKNTTEVPINNVSVSVALNTNALDFKTLKSSWYVFDSRNNTISWTSASFPKFAVLNPFEEGEAAFEVKVKDPPPVKKSSDKNFVIISDAKIQAGDIPTTFMGLPLGNEDHLEIKINSKVLVNAKGFYYASQISNSGPIPPKVGARTTYTLIWQIANYSSDLENVVVQANLSPQVEWVGKLNPAGEKVEYDKASGIVQWNIDKLSSGVGVISPSKQVAFQVAIVPAINQIGQFLDLILESRLSAKDIFTGRIVEAKDSGINTQLPDDARVGYQKGKVVQ